MDPKDSKEVFNCAKKLLKVENKKDICSKGRTSSSLASRTGTCGGETSSFPVSPNPSNASNTFDDLSGNFSDNSSKAEKKDAKDDLSDSVFFEDATSTADVSSSAAESRLCKCKSCRTAALTSLSSQAPLRCYYCSPPGILIEAESSKDADKVSDPLTPSPPLTCLDCGQHFPTGLPFIKRLVGELSEDIAHWAADWQSKRALADLEAENGSGYEAADAVLEAWRKSHLQLGKLLAGDSLPLLQSTLKLAGAYGATEGGGGQAVELLAGAAKTLLGDAYEPLESVLEKEALLEALSSAMKMFQEVSLKDFDSQSGTSFDVVKGLEVKIEQLKEVMLPEKKVEESVFGGR